MHAPARLHDAAARAAAFLESVPDDGPAPGSSSPAQQQQQQQQQALPPLRSGWLPAGDALAAPAALAGAAVAARALPVYLFVPALPLLFGGALYGCAIKAAGVPPGRLHESRVVSSAVLTIAAAGAAAILVYHAPWLPPAATATQTALFVAFFALYAAVALGDPGRVTKSCVDARATAHHGGLCVPCGTLKPLRSRHCRACARCVRRFDHHCPAVGVCVGEGNQRAFTMMVCVAAVGQASYAVLAWAALRRAFAAGAPSWWRALAAVAAASPGCFALAAFMAKLACGSAFLTARALRNAARNITVAEAARPRRHPYLQASVDGKRMDSLLDAGPVANCAQFWRGAPVDWSAAVDAALDARHRRSDGAEMVELAPLALERAV